MHHAQASFGLDAQAGSAAGRSLRRRRRALDGRQVRVVALTALVAAVLTALTIFTFAHLPRYALPGEAILANADFRQGFAGWDVRGIVTLDEDELGHATLQNLNAGDAAYLRRTVKLPRGRTSVLVSADVATRQVARGQEPWQSARIYLVQESGAGEHLWHQPHEVVNLVGTAERHHVRRVFEIPASVPRVVLGIELPYATGQLEIANLRLALVDELPSFRLAAALIVAAWCLLGSFSAWNVARAIERRKIRGLLGVTLAVLLVGLFMPSTLRQGMIDRLAAGFGIDFVSPDAFGHAVIFAALALLVRWGRPRDPLLLHFSCWVLVGAMTEALQLLTADRDPEAGDWIADLAGIVIGLACAQTGLAIERFLARSRKERRAPLR